MRAFASSPFFIVVFFFFTSIVANGQSLFTKLPKDGTSATYKYEILSELPGLIPRSLKGTLTIRVVGTESVRKKTYRWIEIETDTSDDTGENHLLITHKLLAPEENAIKGVDIFHNTKIVWYRCESKITGDLTLKQIPKPNFYYFVVPGKISPTELQTKLVETKLGKLKSKGFKSTFEVKNDDEKSGKQIVNLYKITTYSNDQTPFGTVELKSIHVTGRSRTSTTLSLLSVDHNTKSAMPKHKLKAK